MHCGRNVAGSVALAVIAADFAESLQAPSLRQQSLFEEQASAMCSIP